MLELDYIEDRKCFNEIKKEFAEGRLTEEDIYRLNRVIFHQRCELDETLEQMNDSHSEDEYMHALDGSDCAERCVSLFVEAVRFADKLIESSPRTKIVSDLQEEVQKAKKALIKEGLWEVEEDSLQLKMDLLRERLGDKVGKTADVETGRITEEHQETAKTQVEISKALMQANRKKKGKV